MKNRWFETATPESVGISSWGILRLIDAMYFQEEGREIHGFLIIRNKKIIAEGSFSPFADEQHVIHSCSKAFVSTAIGFAQDEGLLSVEDPILKYLWDIAPSTVTPELERLTIRHLLTMSNGHETNVFFRPYKEGEPEKLKRDFMAAPFKYEPGTKFAYENTNTYMLAEIIQRASGIEIIDYLRPRLFEKLSIDPFYYTDANGMFVGYGGMRMTREALARLGQFYLDGCVWNGERLLSEEWAKEATRFHIITGAQTSTPGIALVKATDWNQGYAFQMWRGQHNSFRFCGAYGQICACYPDENLIFCVNSGSTQTIQEVLSAFYENVLIPIKDVLPENPNAHKKLVERCKNLMLPSEFSSASPVAALISGKRNLIENCKEVISATLDFKEELCHILLEFKNGESFAFDAGLKEIKKTDCYDTHVVSMQPRDYAVAAASGAWKSETEFCVAVRMLPTHTMFYLNFLFDNDTCVLKSTIYRGNDLGASV
ncbi:MAG: serine hydrolase [Clostridia bacterium]|nr:serine hydrolase [Clostridia bacterium]